MGTSGNDGEQKLDPALGFGQAGHERFILSGKQSIGLAQGGVLAAKGQGQLGERVDFVGEVIEFGNHPNTIGLQANLINRFSTLAAFIEAEHHCKKVATFAPYQALYRNKNDDALKTGNTVPIISTR